MPGYDAIWWRPSFKEFVASSGAVGKVQVLADTDVHKEREVRADIKQRVTQIVATKGWRKRCFAGDGGRSNKRRLVIGHLAEAVATSLRVSASQLSDAQNTPLDLV